MKVNLRPLRYFSASQIGCEAIPMRLSLINHLVGGLEHFLFFHIIIENNHPNWVIFLRGIETTNQSCLIFWVAFIQPGLWERLWTVPHNRTTCQPVSLMGWPPVGIFNDSSHEANHEAIRMEWMEYWIWPMGEPFAGAHTARMIE